MTFRAKCGFFLFFVLFANAFKSLGQSFPVSYDFNFYSRIDDSIYSLHQKNHTAIKPFIERDTLIQQAFGRIQAKRYTPERKNFFIRKLFNEHLVQYYAPDFSLYFDFFPDLQIGRDFTNQSGTWLNTRGFQLGGSIGKQIYFQSSYFENQGKFPGYLSDYVLANRVVPGQGFVGSFGKTSFDFSSADGYVSFSPSKYFTFQLGQGKNFIGDGYRSLLLSDNAFNYPFFKIISTVGPIRYVDLWTQLIDFHDRPFTDSVAFPNKFSVFQYLDWTINKHATIGVFENVMVKPRGFDFNYVNPIIFLRAINFSEGSPDKLTLGFTGSYKFLNHYVGYAQLLINEFTLHKVFGDPGYWANKQGFQLGGRAFDFLDVKRLNALLEFNTVRPFTYTADEHIRNYGHYNQPLADPLGTNFREVIGIFSYGFHRFDVRAQLNYAYFGVDDPAHPGVTTGGDIYKAYSLRTSNEGFFIGSGIHTHLRYADLKVSYTLNYRNNLRLEAGFVNRNEENRLSHVNTNFFTIGVRGSFRNFYYDF